MSQTFSAPTSEAVQLFRRGMDFLANGQRPDGARCLVQAVKASPGFFEAHYNLGLVFQQAGQLPEAIACYREALRLRPDHASSWNNLGAALKDTRQPAEAASCHRKAIDLAPGEAGFWNGLGNALRALDQPAAAITELRRALEKHPRNAFLWHNLGNACREAGELPASIEAFESALRVSPSHVEGHWDLAFSLLLSGDFQRGWEEYEWRWKRPDCPPRQFAKPAWTGQDIAGSRLLVYAEQGAGDAIQFVRYVPELARKGARVVLECPKSLVRLFRPVEGVEAVVARGEPLPAFDFHCALVSLPLRFGTQLDSVPAAVPYLKATESQAQLPPAPGSGPRRRVGLVWSGNPAHVNDRRRSVPFELFKPLLNRTDLAFYSLQLGHKGPALDGGLIDLSPGIQDFADTAAFISALDLVISVDTSVAHLAGALGKPVWLLLPKAPDWRWLLGRDDSPWYPRMRLLRQAEAGDWAGVLERVGASLRLGSLL